METENRVGVGLVCFYRVPRSKVTILDELSEETWTRMY